LGGRGEEEEGKRQTGLLLKSKRGRDMKGEKRDARAERLSQKLLDNREIGNTALWKKSKKGGSG